MFKLTKSMTLSLGLLVGTGLSAYAQSDNIAALPPGSAPPAAAAPIGPSGPYPGPDPGRLWGAQERQTGPVQASPRYVGPDPGTLWGRDEKQTAPVRPSPQYLGPSPSSDTGDE